MRLEEFSELKVLKETKSKQITLVWNEILQRCFVKKRYWAHAKPEVYTQLSKLHHKGIVFLYEVIQEENEIVIIEEYLQGELFSNLMDTAPIEQKMQWFYQICEALTILHKQGLVYRDVKPENIMIVREDAVLFDFDIAKVCTQTQATTTMMGTYGYASPEQFGFSHIDARSDIYALGILLNEILTNQHPKYALADKPYRAIVEKCIALNPEDRFQQVEDIMMKLKDPYQRKKITFDWKDAIIFGIAIVFFLMLNLDKSLPVYEQWLQRLSFTASIPYISAMRHQYMPRIVRVLVCKTPNWLHWMIYLCWWLVVAFLCLFIGVIFSVIIETYIG